MRDPNRIDGILEQVAEVWRRFPDLRLGQLILNLDTENRMYMMEDDMLVEKLQENYHPERWSGYGYGKS